MIATASPVRTLTPLLARRLAIARQGLAGPTSQPDPAGILDLVRDLGCLQIDPISAVARSHLLVLWSRLGAYDPAHLDTLLWREHSLFEYWAHCASIVLTEDYPIHSAEMRAYGKGSSASEVRLRAWVGENDALRRTILSELDLHGPLPSRYFEDEAVRGWPSRGWTGGRNVGRMLDYLWSSGQIMVAGRAGGQKLWDLSERCLPEWTPRQELPWREVVRRAAQKSLRALGVAKPAHITRHYTRARYPALASVLAELEAEGRVVRVEMREEGGRAWPGPWYVHAEDMPLLEQLETGDGWAPRTTLLSPFDNLICDRARTEQLWSFRYRVEIYVPKHLREYGYYVLPILHGDRLISRIDPFMDRARSVLTVNAVYAEPNAPADEHTARAVADAVAQLAIFLGAAEIEYGGAVPEGWRHALRS